MAELTPNEADLWFLQDLARGIIRAQRKAPRFPHAGIARLPALALSGELIVLLGGFFFGFGRFPCLRWFCEPLRER